MAKTQKTMAKEIIYENFGFAKNKITDIDITYSNLSTNTDEIISIDFYVNNMQFCVMYEGKNEWSLHIVDSKHRIQFGYSEQCFRCRYHR